MNNDLELSITGNPFVDSGIFALKNRLKKDISNITVDDLKVECQKISDLYVTKAWQTNMYTFFPNSVLVHNRTKDDPNLNKLYLEKLNDLIEAIGPKQNSGSCMACGRYDATDNYVRDYIPLTGSNSLLNYFSYANTGADYCPLCTLLVQFSPLVMYRCGGKMIALHSDSLKVMDFWSKKAINDVDFQISSGEYAGCYNKGITKPTNAIFEIIANVIESSDRWRGENPSLNFYYFTNYNQGAELDIFSLPTEVFNFLTEIPLDDKSNWKFIVKKSYRFVKWDKVENEEDYKNNPNTIYENLLAGKSILKSFFSVKYKRTYCSWKLVNSYMREVWNMDEKRINVIKDVGDRLSDFIKNNDSRKTLSDLEQASNYNNFRNVLRKVLVKKIKNNDDELLFTFDEYTLNLFPEGNMTWRETQDLLLFRIYENLQEWLVEKDYVEEVSEDELLEED